ncbi:MAG: toll/interleukin-1 receptor domain-containing protein [Desulfobacteraceae bacterium]|nr:toll/interleukin-1 receptor domain-containing protein [Desulfobacteraceae bacterium]
MKIFLSYAKEDVKIAKRLYDDLKREGFESWDEEDILPGEHVSLFNKEIKDSSVILLLFSVNSVSKRGEFVKQQKFILKLLDEIPDSETFIIPVRLNDCELLDERLQNLKPADLFPSYENGLEKILKALHRKKPIWQNHRLRKMIITYMIQTMSRLIRKNLRQAAAVLSVSEEMPKVISSYPVMTIPS